MKKNKIIIVGLAAVIISLITAMSIYGAVTVPNTTTDTTYIDETKAIEIAQNDVATIDEGEQTLLKSRFDYDDRRAEYEVDIMVDMYVYEIEFFANFSEYEAEVDAVTGDIIDFEMDD